MCTSGSASVPHASVHDSSLPSTRQSPHASAVPQPLLAYSNGTEPHLIPCRAQVCRAFVDVLLAAQETAGPAAAEAYRECLVLLTSELVGKLRFSRNGRALMAFDNETRNDASLTEWDEHVVTCTEIMFEVGDRPRLRVCASAV